MFNIARGTSSPLQIDPLSLQKKIGLYCRGLVEVDCSGKLLERILVPRKPAGYDFFINISYKKCNSFIITVQQLVSSIPIVGRG